MTETQELLPVTDAKTDRDAERAAQLGTLYRATQAEMGCTEIVCTFPHDGNCWCFNTALTHLASEQRAPEQEGLDEVDLDDLPETPWHIPNTLFIRLSGDGKHIRKWSCEPFEYSVPYQVPRAPENAANLKRLQDAWDASDGLPPIEFTQAEADGLLTALTNPPINDSQLKLRPELGGKSFEEIEQWERENNASALPPITEQPASIPEQGLVEAATALSHYAWSCVTTDCKESGEYLQSLLDNLRTALSTPPANSRDEQRCAVCGNGKGNHQHGPFNEDWHKFQPAEQPADTAGLAELERVFWLSIRAANDGCTCGEVAGEDPDCALHGRETPWDIWDREGKAGIAAMASTIAGRV